MIKLSAISCIALLGLMGCAEAMKVTQAPVNVAVKSTSQNRQIFGFTEPVVRSYVKAGDKRSEVAGARCALDSAEFSAELTTPAIVRMPIVKGRPTAMNITCRTPDSAGALRFEPKLNGTAVGGASAAGLVAAVVTSAIVASRDRWSYGTAGAPIAVEMAQGAQ